MLLKPFEQTTQRVKHALSEFVPVRRYRHVLVRTPIAWQIRQQEAAWMVLRRGNDVVDLVGVLCLLLFEPLLGLVAHATKRFVVLIRDEITR